MGQDLEFFSPFFTFSLQAVHCYFFSWNFEAKQVATDRSFSVLGPVFFKELLRRWKRCLFHKSLWPTWPGAPNGLCVDE